MTLQGKVRMYIVIILGVKAHAFHHAAYRTHFGKLGIFYGKGELIGYDFPAHLAIEGNGIRVEEGKKHSVSVYVVEG